MCTSIAFTIASSALTVASSIAQANAIKAEGEASQNYYNYLAQTNEQQALLSERTGRAQSKAVQDVQAIKGKQLKQSQAEFRSSQTAALAASGVGISSVTAMDIDRNTLTKQSLDENLLRYNADIQSYEAKTGAANQAYGLRSQASGYRTAGANAREVSRYEAGGTLLGGFASAVTPFIFTPLKPQRGVTTGRRTTSRGISVPSTYTPRY